MRRATKLLLVWFAFWLGVGLLLAATFTMEHPVEAKPKLSVKVSPLAGMAPLDVKVVIRIEPDPDNRAAVVMFENGYESRSSYIQLDGELAQKIFVVPFKRISGGHGVFVVAVYNAAGEVWARTEVRVDYIGLTYTIPDWAEEPPALAL